MLIPVADVVCHHDHMISREYRHHDARPGYDLHDALDLPGWENQSIWGWDQMTSSFYAQLWRNNSSSDAPDIWLSGAMKTYPWPGSVALEIVERTQADADTVIRAMGLADPNPQLRDEQEILKHHHEFAAISDQAGYVKGLADSLAWIRGKHPETPGTGTPWHDGRPSASRVVAEHHMVTGQVYRDPDRGTFAGADTGLFWSLGRISQLL